MSDICCPVTAARQQHGDSVALVLPGEQLTYRQFSTLVESAVAAMKTRGWKEGDRIGLVMPNCGEYLVLLAAMFRLRIIACPLNTRLPLAALRLQIEQLRCRAVITDRPCALDAGGVSVIAVIELAADAPGTGNPAEPTSAQPATILFTSGSSGHPRGALHTYGNHYYSAYGSNDNIPFGPGDRWLLSLPLYHVGGIGIVFRAWVSAGTVVIPGSVKSLAEAIGTYGVTHLSLVSTQLHRLIEQEPNFGARSLKHILLGGSAMPQGLVERAVRDGLPVHTSYGLTEMASQVTTTSLADIPDKLHTAGKPLRYRQVKVTADGDIFVRGETLFAGYISGASVELPTDDQGWFETGDVGYFDAGGYLIVSGRRDAMFISGGENVHPEEIEQALLNLPFVSQALVVPRLDPEYGCRPVAFIAVDEGRWPHPGEIRSSLGNILPRYKIPDRILPWPQEIPPGMKPDRIFFRHLADELVDFTP